MKRKELRLASTFLPFTTLQTSKQQEDANIIMIRQATILFKLFLIKLSDMELLGAMLPDYRHCPACGATGCCEQHDEYNRDMITIEKGVRMEYEVTIHRVICKSCGVTHALLSDVLIPYSSYTLRFVLHALRALFTRTCTVEELCERYGIAVSTIYEWKKLFKEHANLWLSVLNRIYRVSIQALDDFENIHRLPSAFFRRYGFSFLQRRQTTYCNRSP
jgi:transcriptional regulator with XRE-family HTH domain